LCILVSQHEKQTVVPQSFPFPCPQGPGARSEKPPVSVHKLRPGDIDVIATIGDSLTTATGAVAKTFYDIITNDNRGMSWSAGDKNTPYILKISKI